MNEDWPGVITVVGATATGKSDLALDLAERLGGEVINADAMQFYRGMDIGTAKLPVADRRGVPHHMIDTLDLWQEASVAAYQREVRALIGDLRRRRVAAIVVGGSGLYVRAIVDDLRFPGTDPEIRAGLEARAAAQGLGPLVRELHDRDPRAASSIKPTDARRVIRALEVMELTGQEFSATMPRYDAVYPTVQLGLALPREELGARIRTRIDAMWDAGWVAEVEGLLPLGLEGAPTASGALGYRQIMAHLRGDLSEGEAKEETALRTRQFAKRQGTWFRRDPRVAWFDAGAPGRALEHAARLLP